MRPLLTIYIVFVLGFLLGGRYEQQLQPRSLDVSMGLLSIPEKPLQYDKSQSAKVAKLEKYFTKYHSPLATQAAYLVGIGGEYGLDYRLIPAISVVESTACRFYITSTYNCSGYGSGHIYFQSFEQAETAVAKAISTGKAYRNFQSTGHILDLARVYNGGDYQGWSYKVERFMAEIER